MSLGQIFDSVRWHHWKLFTEARNRIRSCTIFRSDAVVFFGRIPLVGWSVEGSVRWASVRCPASPGPRVKPQLFWKRRGLSLRKCATSASLNQTRKTMFLVLLQFGWRQCRKGVSMTDLARCSFNRWDTITLEPRAAFFPLWKTGRDLRLILTYNFHTLNS